MQCDEARERIDALHDGELAGEMRQNLLAHLDGCAACAQRVADAKRLQQQLVLAGEPAPRALLERTRAALAAEAQPIAVAAPRPRDLAPGRLRPLARQLAALVAAAVFSVLATWWVLQRSDSRAAIEHDAFTAHFRSLVQDNTIQIASADTHTVKPWFAGRLEFSPVVRDLSGEGFTLAGGRLDYIAGRRVAALVYRRRLHMVTVFTWPAANAEDSRPFAA
ncbi:MAG: zf-HC2 domain-containing protein, partial [Proteobacteria bacterium]|nr:zf-HC2 domain-containing protein [Pseudomonadota bacterium]